MITSRIHHGIVNDTPYFPEAGFEGSQPPSISSPLFSCSVVAIACDTANFRSEENPSRSSSHQAFLGLYKLFPLFPFPPFPFLFPDPKKSCSLQDLVPRSQKKGVVLDCQQYSSCLTYTTSETNDTIPVYSGSPPACEGLSWLFPGFWTFWMYPIFTNIHISCYVVSIYNIIYIILYIYPKYIWDVYHIFGPPKGFSCCHSSSWNQPSPRQAQKPRRLSVPRHGVAATWRRLPSRV